MQFDIRQAVFDPKSGEYLEKRAIRYREQLMQLFRKSPEGKELRTEGIEPSWDDLMIDFGISYLGVTPPQMSAANLREILFELIPRKVSALPEQAPQIIQELQFFWRFLQREFQLQNAANCLKVLDNKAVRKLQDAMNNPANFGPAKSFVMEGIERGFDMTTQEGVQEWMAIYNAERGVATKSPTSSSSQRGISGQQTRSKTRRKMEMRSRRKNSEESTE